MATKHNVTLAIDLRQLVAEDGQYTQARKRALALLSSPLSLGGRPLSREELHERRCLR